MFGLVWAACNNWFTLPSLSNRVYVTQSTKSCTTRVASVTARVPFFLFFALVPAMMRNELAWKHFATQMKGVSKYIVIYKITKIVRAS